jgi:hypothetical protein
VHGTVKYQRELIDLINLSKQDGSGTEKLGFSGKNWSSRLDSNANLAPTATDSGNSTTALSP